MPISALEMLGISHGNSAFTCDPIRSTDTTNNLALSDIMERAVKRLKLCPFCGSEARYGRGGADWQPERLWTAGCIHGHAISPDMENKEEAAEWWNRRYTGPQYPKKETL